jgi:hypothetical protein
MYLFRGAQAFSFASDDSPNLSREFTGHDTSLAGHCKTKAPYQGVAVSDTGFVSGYRFSDTASSSKSDAPLGAGRRLPRSAPLLTAQEKYVSVGQEVPLNHEASECSREKKVS